MTSQTFELFLPSVANLGELLECGLLLKKNSISAFYSMSSQPLNSGHQPVWSKTRVTWSLMPFHKLLFFFTQVLNAHASFNLSLILVLYWFLSLAPSWILQTRNSAWTQSSSLNPTRRSLPFCPISYITYVHEATTTNPLFVWRNLWLFP